VFGIILNSSSVGEPIAFTEYVIIPVLSSIPDTPSKVPKIKFPVGET